MTPYRAKKREAVYGHATVRPLLVAGCTTAVALVLTGCGSLGGILGTEKKPPDEYAVVSRAPLSGPPDFTLRPPADGTQPPPASAATEDARRAVFGLSGQQATVNFGEATKSPGERALLREAGAEGASPAIRRQIEEENSGLIAEDKSLVDQLVFWRDKPNPNERLVDPNAESQRLRENDALGKPPTEGETPSFAPAQEQKGLLNRLLDGLF